MAPKSYGLLTKDDCVIRIKGVTTKELNYAQLKQKFYESDKIEIGNQLNIKRSDLVLTQDYISKKISFSGSTKRNFNVEKTHTTPFSILPGI
jgi:hypothetical protein